MSESVAAANLREVLEALSAHDLDRVSAVVDESFEFVDVGGGEVMHTREEWRAFCGVFVTAFPDLTQDVRLLVDAGEYAFAEVVARGLTRAHWSFPRVRSRRPAEQSRFPSAS